ATAAAVTTRSGAVRCLVSSSALSSPLTSSIMAMWPPSNVIVESWMLAPQPASDPVTAAITPGRSTPSTVTADNPTRYPLPWIVGARNAPALAGAPADPGSAALGGSLAHRRHRGPEALARVLHLTQGDRLPLEEQSQSPVDDDADLAVQRRHPRQMVSAVHEPRRKSAKLDAVDVGDALMQAETGDRSDILVPVFSEFLPAEVADHVVGEHLGLADRVLGVGRAELTRVRQVGHRRRVAGREGAGAVLDGEGGQGLDPAALVERQVAGVHDRARLDPGRPHERLGVELGAVRQHHVPAHAGFEPGLQPDVDAALAQLLQ